MPRGSWTARDERQYKAILKSCKSSRSHPVKVCKRIAAATVNKFRAARKRRRSSKRR